MPSTQNAHSSQEQHPPATGASFFASIRRAGIVRTQERWGGGVAGGLARRFNIDAAIMRGVFVVATLFGGIGLLVYGLCWALLPEEGDGRIHLEEAMAGRFDAALAAAGAAVVVGLARPGLWFAPFGGGGPWGVFVAIVAIGAVIAIIAVAHTRTTGDREAATGRSEPAMPAAGASTGTVSTGAASTEGAVPGAAQASVERVDQDEQGDQGEQGGEQGEQGDTVGIAESTHPESRGAATAPLESPPPPLWSAQAQPADAGAPTPMPGQPVPPAHSGPTGPIEASGQAGQAGQAGPTWSPTPPVPPPAGPSRWRRSAPGYRLVLLGLAGVFLVVAAVLLAWFTGYLTMAMPPLVMAGGALIAVGGVIAVAGLIGRRGGFLTVVGLVGVVVSAVLVATAFDGYGRRPLAWDTAHTVASAPSTFRVTSVADFERFEDWEGRGGSGVVLDLAPLAQTLPDEGLNLGTLRVPGAAPFEVRLPAEVPAELRVTGENAWVDGGDLTGIRAEAVRVVDGWDWNQWVLGANGELTFDTGIVGEPLRLHLDVPDSHTTITFVQEQS